MRLGWMIENIPRLYQLLPWVNEIRAKGRAEIMSDIDKLCTNLHAFEMWKRKMQKTNSGIHKEDLKGRYELRRIQDKGLNKPKENKVKEFLRRDEDRLIVHTNL